MYERKKFDEREAEYSILLRRKLEEAEAMLQHLAPSRARSLALTKLDEESAQKEAAMGKDGASHHLAELELLARAQKDWYYAMMSYIMGGDSDAEEESK